MIIYFVGAESATEIIYKEIWRSKVVFLWAYWSITICIISDMAWTKYPWFWHLIILMTVPQYCRGTYYCSSTNHNSSQAEICEKRTAKVNTVLGGVTGAPIRHSNQRLLPLRFAHFFFGVWCDLSINFCRELKLEEGGECDCQSHQTQMQNKLYDTVNSVKIQAIFRRHIQAKSGLFLSVSGAKQQNDQPRAWADWLLLQWPPCWRYEMIEILPWQTCQCQWRVPSCPRRYISMSKQWSTPL